jgi:hypothetical protein
MSHRVGRRQYSGVDGFSFSKLVEGWAISGVVTLQSGVPFSILDSAAGTLLGPPTYFTTGNLAPGATLDDALENGRASSRVNEFFNTSGFVPAPFIRDGGVIDGQFPVTDGGTIFGNLGRMFSEGPASATSTSLSSSARDSRRKSAWFCAGRSSTCSIGRILPILRAMSRVRARSERSAR